MVKLNFKIDKRMNFLWHLRSIYSDDPGKINRSYYQEHKELLDKALDFHILEEEIIEQIEPYESVENWWEEESKRINSIFKSEKQKFNEIWSQIKSDLEDSLKEIKAKWKEFSDLVDKIPKETGVEWNQEEIDVYLVKPMGKHGRQRENHILIPEIEDLSLKEKCLVILHELIHVNLYKFMEKQYATLKSSEEIHDLEEATVNGTLFKLLEPEEVEMCPFWAKFLDCDKYHKFMEISGNKDFMRKKTKSFLKDKIEQISSEGQ